MELLIPGLILVALMIYASTKIKRSAARAFESESVETEEFFIDKPEGFIHPLHDDSGFAFTAFSKEFGSDGLERVRRAYAKISRFEHEDFEGVSENIRSSLSSVTSDKADETGRLKVREIAGSLQEDGVDFGSFNKIMWKGGKVFALRINVLPEHKDDFARKIQEMADSFYLK